MEPVAEEGVSNSRACALCRQKRQKCSQEDPCCSCLTSGCECIYEHGQHIGAAKFSFVKSLMKRIDTLESLVLRQSLLLSSNLNLATPTQADDPDDIKGAANGINLSESLHAVHEELLRPPKRQKAGHAEQPPPPTPGADPRASGSASNVLNEAPHRLLLNYAGGNRREFLPPASMLRKLIDVYFTQINPWIPILHKPTYTAARCSSGSYPPTIVLQAITAATIKFYKPDSSKQEWYRQRCHEAVVLNCMDRFSIESLQASIIMAFSTIRSGNGPNTDASGLCGTTTNAKQVLHPRAKT